MAYKRKTETVYNVQGFYYGEWETVTAETEFYKARERLKEYRENQPGAYRLWRTRERIES